ncbi:DUF2190 family protein [Teredinibacter purpureus]|uniref:DUF2190 family protein n=1 Tax=Teredinibacter purpureus TaxID=2731756 RepID=UPI0005F7D487|nr:DUF2190 family protein [Teredinibacter purpureus]
MLNHVQKGDVLTFTAAADLNGGDGVLLGTAGLFGVVQADVLSGEQGEAVVVECYTLPKTSADTPAAYAAAYWDDGNSRLTTAASDNTKIGYFLEAYGAGTTEASVRLCP